MDAVCTILNSGISTNPPLPVLILYCDQFLGKGLCYGKKSVLIVLS